MRLKSLFVSDYKNHSYEGREPIKVRINNEELVILSFPGPDRPIRIEGFPAGRAVSRR